MYLNFSCSPSSSYWRTSVLEHHGKCSERSGPPPGQHLHLLVTRGLSLITNDGADLQQWLLGRGKTWVEIFIFHVWTFTSLFFRVRSLWYSDLTHCLWVSNDSNQFYWWITVLWVPDPSSLSLAFSLNPLLLFLIRKLPKKLCWESVVKSPYSSSIIPSVTF